MLKKEALSIPNTVPLVVHGRVHAGEILEPCLNCQRFHASVLFVGQEKGKKGKLTLITDGLVGHLALGAGDGLGIRLSLQGLAVIA